MSRAELKKKEFLFMQNNVMAYLFDIQTSALAVKDFVCNHTF